MKQLGAITFSLAIAAAMSGCASTSGSNSGKYPELKVYSDKTYVWDNSASEALNIARMAQPAGVGVGMSDFADGTKANTGKLGAGEQIFDSALGMASMGAFGVLSMGILNSDVNEMLDWQPSLVVLIPAEDITDAGKFDLRKTQLIVGEKVEASLRKSLNDVTWHGAFTTRLFSDSNVTYAFNTSQCGNSFKVHYIKPENAPSKAFHNDKLIFEKGDFSEFCAVRLQLKIAGLIDDSGKRKAIVVGEVAEGHYFMDSMKSTFDGYMIFPESFKVATVDSKSGKRLGYPYAYAMKNGKELKFQSK